MRKFWFNGEEYDMHNKIDRKEVLDAIENNHNREAIGDQTMLALKLMGIIEGVLGD